MVIFFQGAEFIPLLRTEINSMSEIIASCGGLMGLFMGVSLMSVVELFYYCTLRPVAMWALAKPKKARVAECEKGCQFECETSNEELSVDESR